MRVVIAIDLVQNGAVTQLAKSVSKTIFSPVIIFSATVINPRLHANSIDEASWQETIHINLNEPFPVV